MGIDSIIFRGELPKPLEQARRCWIVELVLSVLKAIASCFIPCYKKEKQFEAELRSLDSPQKKAEHFFKATKGLPLDKRKEQMFRQAYQYFMAGNFTAAQVELRIIDCSWGDDEYNGYMRPLIKDHSGNLQAQDLVMSWQAFETFGLLLPPEKQMEIIRVNMESGTRDWHMLNFHLTTFKEFRELVGKDVQAFALAMWHFNHPCDRIRNEAYVKMAVLAPHYEIARGLMAGVK